MKQNFNPKEQNKKGKIIIISGPSGCGKTTVANYLKEMSPDISTSVSATTRAPRKGEINEKDYYFLNSKQFLDLKNNGQFLESAQVFDNYYGTPKKIIYDQINQGKFVICVIDWNGGLQIINNMPPDLVLSIFLLPPSLEELEARLRNRKTDSAEVIKKRLSQASQDCEKSSLYSQQIINHDSKETALKIFTMIKGQ